MEVRFAPNPPAVQRLTTEELRRNFLIEDLFQNDHSTFVYSDVGREIIGGIVPQMVPLQLLANKKEMAADFFCERREAGVINIGSRGSVTVDGKVFTLDTKDVLYIGRGSKEILFSSEKSDDPAVFYLTSYPAHTEYPSTLAKFSEAEQQRLGSQKDANKRVIRKYIHPNGIKSCQLVMGMTELDEGSVWNTMPVHTHLRRAEVYLYFNLQPDAVVFHMMGEPTQCRTIVTRNRQAVISPSWSIHSGAGTSNYSFVWSMGGENQAFDDMDHVSMKDLA